MQWQPVSELTPEIVESAWRLIVWDGSETWTFEKYLSDDGMQELTFFDGGTIRIKWAEFGGSTYPFTHFAVIDAPPACNLA
jgi:hypothetical protein